MSWFLSKNYLLPPHQEPEMVLEMILLQDLFHEPEGPCCS
jgi:hypothetical protein